MHVDSSAPNGLKMRATGLVRAYCNLRNENTGDTGPGGKFVKACESQKKPSERNGIILSNFHAVLDILFAHSVYHTYMQMEKLAASTR